MTSEYLEALINDLISMRGKAPDEEMLEKQIEELKTKMKLAVDVEKETEMEEPKVEYCVIPSEILSIMTSAQGRGMNVKIDAVHNRLCIKNKACGAEVQIDITYSNTCRMWALEAKGTNGNINMSFNGKFGGDLLVRCVMDALSYNWLG